MIRIRMRFKIYIGIVILLLIIPTLSYEIMKMKNGKFTVGIILTEGCDGNYSEYAEEGLYHTYGEKYIKVVRIGEELNVSGLDTRIFLNSTQYSADSFLDPAFTNGLHSRNNVDTILIVTQHDVSSWKDIDLNFVFGKASTESATCMMSVERLTADNMAEDDEKMYIGSVSAHEVGHLLGYVHTEKKCIMQYSNTLAGLIHGSDVLCSEYQSELKYRTVFFQEFHGNDLSTANRHYNAVILLLSSIPYLFAALVVVQMLLELTLYKDQESAKAVLPTTFAATYITTVFQGYVVGVCVGLLVLGLFYLLKVKNKESKSGSS